MSTTTRRSLRATPWRPSTSATPAQAPAHRRGFYVGTEAVARLDLAPLPPEPLAPERVTREDAVASGRGAIAKGARAGAPDGGT